MKAKSYNIKWLILSLALFSILVNVFALKEARSGDSFISMYFGLNLYEGRYLEFNAGEPSSGASSPLWMYLHAVVRFISIHFDELYTHFILMKAVNVIILILSCLVLWKIMEDSETPPVIQAVVLISWALNPFVINWTTRCLELPLQALTCWYGIYRILLNTRRNGRRASFVDGLVFGLIVLTRYESAILLVFLSIYGLFSKRWNSIYDLVLLVCGFLLVYGYHMVFMLSVFGTLLPSTAVKGGRLSLSGMEPAKHLLYFYGPFILIFIANLFKFSKMTSLKRVVSLWIIAHLGFVVFILGYSHLQRYFLVVIPFIIWFSLDSELLSFIPRYAKKLPAGKIIAVASVVILLSGGGLLAYARAEGSLLNGFLVYQSEDLKARTGIAEYIKNHVSPEATVAMKEVDWIPLYSKCRTLDIVGILYDDLKAHDGSVIELLKEEKPEYIVLEENFVRIAPSQHETVLFKKRLLNALREDKNRLPSIEGMNFEYVYSVPYRGSGGVFEMFRGLVEHDEQERSKWKWYLLKISYS